jgi:hypothetical protein
VLLVKTYLILLYMDKHDGFLLLLRPCCCTRYMNECSCCDWTEAQYLIFLKFLSQLYEKFSVQACMWVLYASVELSCFKKTEVLIVPDRYKSFCLDNKFWNFSTHDAIILRFIWLLILEFIGLFEVYTSWFFGHSY